MAKKTPPPTSTSTYPPLVGAGPAEHDAAGEDAVALPNADGAGTRRGNQAIGKSHDANLEFYEGNFKMGNNLE